MKYILLDYRDNFNNDLYDHPDIKLNKKDSFLFLAEKKHLINKGLKIIESHDGYGSVIAKDDPKYYKPIMINNRIVNIFIIKHLKIDFSIYQCGKNGIPCEYCNNSCIDYKTCNNPEYHREVILKEIEQFKQKELEKQLEIKRKYIESLPQDNIIKLLFHSNSDY